MRISGMCFVTVISVGVFAGGEPAAMADQALDLLLKKGVITQQEHDQAVKEAAPAAEASTATAEPGAPAKATSPAKVADGENVVDLGKGIKIGYDRRLYTQFKDKFELKTRIRLQFRYTNDSPNSAYGTVGDNKN